MPIPLGVLAVAGAGGGVAAGNAYEWLETVSVGTAVASVSFSNLNSTYGSTYEHLQIRMTGRSSRSDTRDTLRIRANGDSSGNYAMHALKGNGSTVGSEGFASETGIQMYRLTAATADANNFGAIVIDILEPFSTNKTTTFRGLGGATGTNINEVSLNSGFWNNTAAITSIELAATNGNLAIGSRFSLYGLRSA